MNELLLVSTPNKNRKTHCYKNQHKIQPGPPFSSKLPRRTIQSDTFLISSTAIFYTSALFLYCQPITFHHFSLHFCESLLSETPEQPRFFFSRNVGKSNPLETRNRKPAPSSLTVSFSVIHRLPFPSLHLSVPPFCFYDHFISLPSL